jgi:hypothetical protein
VVLNFQHRFARNRKTMHWSVRNLKRRLPLPNAAKGEGGGGRGEATGSSSAAGGCTCGQEQQNVTQEQHSQTFTTTTTDATTSPCYNCCPYDYSHHHPTLKKEVAPSSGSAADASACCANSTAESMASSSSTHSAAALYSLIDDDTTEATTATLTTTMTNEFIRSSFSSSGCGGGGKSRSRRRVDFVTDDEGRILAQVRLYVVEDKQESPAQQEPQRHSFASPASDSSSCTEPVCHFAKYQAGAMNAIVAEDGCRTLLESIDKMYYGSKAVFATTATEMEHRMQAMVRLAKMEHGKYRGLEVMLMQLAHRRRNGHRKDLLERQRTLRSTPKMHYHYPTSSSSSPEEKLRRTSRKYSKASTEFALFLAVCDSLVIQHSVGDDGVVPVHDEQPNVVHHGDNDCDCEKDCDNEGRNDENIPVDRDDVPVDVGDVPVDVGDVPVDVGEDVSPIRDDEQPTTSPEQQQQEYAVLISDTRAEL